MNQQEIIKKLKEYNEKDKKTFVGKVIRIYPQKDYEYVHFITYNESDEPLFISFLNNKLNERIQVGDFIEVSGKLIRKEKVYEDKKTNEQKIITGNELKYISNLKIIEKFNLSSE